MLRSKFSTCFRLPSPKEGLNRMERGRKVQSIFPDMRISIPEEGNVVLRLHELKIISSSKTRYKPHRQGQEAKKAVDKRAEKLNSEYISKARATDQMYCGTEVGTDHWTCGDQAGILGRGQRDCGRRLRGGIRPSSQPYPPPGCIKGTSRRPPKREEGTSAL